MQNGAERKVADSLLRKNSLVCKTLEQKWENLYSHPVQQGQLQAEHNWNSSSDIFTFLFSRLEDELKWTSCTLIKSFCSISYLKLNSLFILDLYLPNSLHSMSWINPTRPCGILSVNHQVPAGATYVLKTLWVKIQVCRTPFSDIFSCPWLRWHCAV